MGEKQIKKRLKRKLTKEEKDKKEKTEKIKMMKGIIKGIDELINKILLKYLAENPQKRPITKDDCQKLIEERPELKKFTVKQIQARIRRLRTRDDRGLVSYCRKR